MSTKGYKEQPPVRRWNLAAKAGQSKPYRELIIKNY